jgi:uncharacterized protein
MHDTECSGSLFLEFRLADAPAGFWARYTNLLRNTVIPYQWAALNDRVAGARPSGAIRNFRIAAGLEQGEFVGMVFQDSDVGKWKQSVAGGDSRTLRTPGSRAAAVAPPRILSG